MSERVDIAVIGAGVVGAAIARAFALDGARVIVLEKAAEVLDGASKGNSAILHTGFDAPEGSLEARLVARGHALYQEIAGRLNLPILRSGALVIAWTEEQEAALPGLMAQARANGVTDIEALDRAALCALEPGLGAGARAAFRVPREWLIDPWSTAHAYLHQCLANGGIVWRGAEVMAARFDGAHWRLETPRGAVTAGLVVNAAGLWGDVVDARLGLPADFTIRPRKGQFVVYDKSAYGLARHILLPVPNAITKGVVVCRTVWGNLLVGPTAEEQEDRSRAVLDRATLEALKARGAEILPALQGHEVTAIYAGLRPATEFKEYRIAAHGDRSAITVGGIRSTGLSAALGIAAHVVGLAAGMGRPSRPLADPVWPAQPNLAEGAPRPWQAPGHGGVICHCEMVTKAEVQAALTGPLPATTLAGLKRRTRVTMGRCQGFYCSAELARMTAGRLTPALAEG
jgi:glycerol-3-phosphate dehydrogenase